MSGYPLRIEVMGEEQVHLGLGRVMQPVEDLSKKVGGRSLWDRWREAFYQSERELFDSEGAAGRSGAWPGLTEPYASWKARHFGGQKILVASGAMRASLVGPGGIYEVTTDSMHIGTELLAGYHWPKRKAIDISGSQEVKYFGRALAEWANDLRKEWEAK